MPTRKKYRNKSRKSRKKRRHFSIKRSIEAYFEAQKENKVGDTASSVSLTTSNLIVYQPNIIRGVAITERVGDEINVHSLYIKIQLIVGDTYNMVRFLIVWDRLNRGGTVTAGDILQDVTVNSTTDNKALISPLNKGNSGRFQIIVDKNLVVDTNTPMIIRKWYIKFKKHRKIEYIANNGTHSDISSGSFLFLAVGDSNAVPHPTFNYWMRMSYTDC